MIERKIIITCALTAGAHTQAMYGHLPITAEKTAIASLRALEMLDLNGADKVGF